MSERAFLYAGLALIFAAVYALAASRLRPVLNRWLRARHARRLAARLVRGSDAYFEELRELQSHAPRTDVPRGFAWYFLRAFAFMMAMFALARLIDFLFSFSSE